MFTVASIAPMSLALWAKAPASTKIQIMSITFLLAAPCEYCMMRSFSESPLVMQMAYTEETKKAFGIPENQEVFALLPLGYPAEESKPSAMHDSRKPLEETVVRL